MSGAVWEAAPLEQRKMNLKPAGENGGTTATKEMTSRSEASLRHAFELCVRKTRRNIQRLADEPKSAAWAIDGDFFKFKEGFFEIGNWTSSFFTGMALLAWEQTEDDFFLAQVRRLAPPYITKVFTRHRDTQHDLGFLYSLYSVPLYALTSDVVHRETGLRAAEVLARRFNPVGNFIRAWGRTDTDEQSNMAIIDCLMNLPLLFWASAQTGDHKFRDIAIRHADTTLNCFVRPDESVFHAFRFDLKTGRPIGGDNYCGDSVDSHWARGSAWAIYGFALAYKYTRDARYLEVAGRLALKFLSLLDREVIPIWDFRLPPGKPAARDSSALAIAVCGLIELAKQDGPDSKFFRSNCPLLLLRLCQNDYLNFDDDCPAVLKSAYGDKAAFSSWGDYFLMEALSRELFQSASYW